MDIFDKIRGWAIDRNLIEGSNPAAQFLKLREEKEELRQAIMANDYYSELKDQWMSDRIARGEHLK